jgi:alpha-beta hydrolase superfamily lysophospholipase
MNAFSLHTHVASDGYAWRWRLYPARGPERGHVVCLHGIQSHGGWYTHSCRRLAEAGYTTCFLDRRGSGLNDQARGDAPGFRRLVKDIAEFLRDRRTAACRPLFLVAISWGGKLALALARRRPGLVDGLALLCPGLCPRIRPPRRQRLAIVLSRLVSPGKLFPIPLDDPELFTATPRWLEFLRDDPLALRKATARFLLESARLDGYLRLPGRRVEAPLLLMLGGKDAIIDNDRTRAFVARLARGEVQVIEYPEAHHTLEFEPDPDVHVGDLLGWLDRQAAAPRPPVTSSP